MLIDEAKIKIKSGDGGKGCESFLRRTDKKTVPNGGDGGDGGDVIFQADRNETSLKSYSFRHFYEAPKGSGGSSNQKTGKKGADLTLKVPCGTTLYSMPDQFLIRDLIHHDEQVVVVKGGRGGAGNDHGRPATEGKAGEELEVLLDYALVADIFFIGTPNSGKSSLLRAITGSKVKTESYPFSTRMPQLGTYQTEQYDRLTLCELPALETGSHQGKGLGNRFLKHLRRARLIFFVIDPVSEFVRDLKEQKQLLEDEMSRFDERFKEIPRFYVIHKSDLDIPEIKGRKKIFGTYTFYVSSQTGEGIDALMKQAGRFLAQAPKEAEKRFEV